VTTTVRASVDDGKRMPSIGSSDVIVRQGKDRLRVTEWVPAQGSQAGLELFVSSTMPPTRNSDRTSTI
jgi:hypothetical protein